MTIRCIRAFGNFIPGDEIEIPADACFDTLYFEKVDEPEAEPKSTSNAKERK